MADNLSIARRLYDGWNERKFDELADMMAPDGRIEIIGSGDVFEGPDGSRRYSTMWSGGFPDGKVTIDNIFGSGDSVVIEYTGSGTHTGPLLTSMGEIPATGRSMTMKLCDVVQFRDGKVASQHTYFDTGSMMAQLGLTEQSATTTK